MNVFDIEIKQERNGLVYLPNETTPFTGKFTAGFDPVTKLQGSEQNFKDGEQYGEYTCIFEYQLTCDDLVGEYGEKHPWITLRKTGSYRHGKRDGKFTLWYETNGQKHSKGEYKEDLKDGKWIGWDVNGHKLFESYFKSGARYGKHTRWYKGGGKKFEGNFIENQDTRVRLLSPSSSFTDCTSYYDQQQERRGSARRGFGRPSISLYWYSGDLFAINNKDGKWIEWHENGTKRAEVNYKDGNENGKFTEWYKNGNMEYEGSYKNGKLDGKLIAWHENTTKRAEINYEDGSRDGEFTQWYKNGQKNTKGQYKNKRRVGKWFVWKKNGKRIYNKNEYIEDDENQHCFLDSDDEYYFDEVKYPNKWYFVIFVVVIIFFLN